MTLADARSRFWLEVAEARKGAGHALEQVGEDIESHFRPHLCAVRIVWGRPSTVG